jgi:spermidine/putrescine transport system substrate-binding protein
MSTRRRPEIASPAVGEKVAAWLQALAEGRVTRREFVVRATALGLSTSSIALFLGACGSGSGDGGSANEPSPLDTSLPASIRVLGWSEYVPPKVYAAFEKKYGVHCVETTFDSIDVMAEKMKAGGAFDVVWSGDHSLTILRSADLVQPLHMDAIPNYTNVGPAFSNAAYDPGTDGKRYSVPYMFGSIGYGVRTDKVQATDETWAPLFDPANKGRISMLDGSREVMAAGLFALGYSSNTTDQAQLDEATEKLIKQKPLILGYDSNTMVDRMVKGQAYTQCFDGDAIAAIKKIGLSKVKYVLPSNGYQLWADAIAIPRTAENVYAAHLFLDFLLDPAIAAEVGNAYGYQPAVEGADAMLKSLVQRAMRPTSEVLQRGSFTQNLGEFDSAYEKAYEKVQQA